MVSFSLQAQPVATATNAAYLSTHQEDYEPMGQPLTDISEMYEQADNSTQSPTSGVPSSMDKEEELYAYIGEKTCD